MEPTPGPTPSPTPVPSGIQPLRILKGLAMMAIGLVGLVVGVSTLFFSAHGKKVTFGTGEEVYYKDGGTEAEARAVGEALKTTGYFDGKSGKSVQVIKSGDLPVVRFVVKAGVWDKADDVNGFQVLTWQLSKLAFEGRAIEVRICDDQMNDKNTLSSLTPPPEGWKVTFPKSLDIHYTDGATEADAQALGKALVDRGTFGPEAVASVQVSKSGAEWCIKFVLKDGAWDDESIVQVFRDLGKDLSANLYANTVVQVRLCDSSWVEKRAFRSDEE